MRALQTTLPAQPKRIILINPTRYLGNLLIAGGLIQDFAHYCSSHGIEFRLVVDDMYADLLTGAFDKKTLILYPRRRIAKAGFVQKCRLYLQCLRGLRRLKADLAFNIEDDSVSHRLTQFSGAAFKLGCSPQRHRWGYQRVLPIAFAERPAGKEHRWYSFQEVFTALGLPQGKPHYLKLQPPALSATLKQRLQQCGVDFSSNLAVLHTGATKYYKLWPHVNFAALALRLQQAGYQVVLMGAGKDARDIEATLAILPESARTHIVNLCNQLSLAELAGFLAAHASLMVGNDSGPFHLAAALGVPGVVVFGPTEASLWGPIADNAILLQDRSVCSADCSRKHCRHNYRCLPAITPDHVMAALEKLQPAK